jgi:hypothetical protein
MLAWIVLTGVVGYLACALLTARAAFGIQRARIIEREARWHADDDAVERFETNDHYSAATGAFLFGLAWPVTVPGYCLYHCVAFVITANPPPTSLERERRAEEQRRHVRHLEESLLDIDR